jgi:pyrroloquinoline quinone (PQQ) biosynthesis protein C
LFLLARLGNIGNRQPVGGQLQAWALNRYYYQARIPVKDATLIARLPTSELRRAW